MCWNLIGLFLKQKSALFIINQNNLFLLNIHFSASLFSMFSRHVHLASSFILPQKMTLVILGSINDFAGGKINMVGSMNIA